MEQTGQFLRASGQNQKGLLGALRDRDWVEKQSIGDLMSLQKAMTKKEMKEQGQNICKAKRDSKPPLVKIAGGEDDCDRTLVSARFLRPPVSAPKKWFRQVPVKYSHVYRNIPLKHMLGLDSIVAPSVIATRHDRKNALQLKHYNRSNANVSSKPIKEIRSRDSEGVSTIHDYDWTLPNTIKQCQDSILNFGAVNRSLWPFDHTDIALTKIFNRYDWFVAADSSADRVKLVQLLFNRIMEENAYRAADKEEPLPYEEMEKIAKEMLVDNGVSADIQNRTVKHESVDKEKMASLEKKLTELEKNVRKPFGGQTGQTGQRPKVGGKEICHFFNKQGRQLMFGRNFVYKTCFRLY